MSFPPVATDALPSPADQPTRIRNQYDIGQKIQGLTLHSIGMSTEEILERTGIAKSAWYYILRVAKSRGYDPAANGRILLKYCEEGKRTGRPKIHTQQQEAATPDSASTDHDSLGDHPSFEC